MAERGVFRDTDRADLARTWPLELAAMCPLSPFFYSLLFFCFMLIFTSRLIKQEKIVILGVYRLRRFGKWKKKHVAGSGRLINGINLNAKQEKAQVSTPNFAFAA